MKRRSCRLKHRSFFLLALLLAGPSVFATSSIDFTPVLKEEKFDGATRQIVFFRSGHMGLGRISLVEYSPPWPITGATGAATMRVPGKDAAASIRTVETQEPLELADEAAVVDWVKKTVPEGATRLQVDQVLKDGVKLNDQGTVEVVLSYAYYGRPLQVSILLSKRCNRPTELVVFEISAKPSEFKQAHEAFLASLYSIVGF